MDELQMTQQKQRLKLALHLNGKIRKLAIVKRTFIRFKFIACNSKTENSSVLFFLIITSTKIDIQNYLSHDNIWKVPFILVLVFI